MSFVLVYFEHMMGGAAVVNEQTEADEAVHQVQSGQREITLVQGELIVSEVADYMLSLRERRVQSGRFGKSAVRRLTSSDVVPKGHLMVWVLVVLKLNLDKAHDSVEVGIDVADPAVPQWHVSILDVQSACGCVVGSEGEPSQRKKVAWSNGRVCLRDKYLSPR
jgi:hypothetical protein